MDREAGAMDERTAPAVDALPIVEQCLDRLGGRYDGVLTRGELVSAGNAGLLAAIRRFDPGLDVPFRWFAEGQVCGAILNAAPAEAKGPGCRQAIPASTERRSPMQRAFASAVAELSDEELLLLELIYVDGLVLADAAWRVGISRTTARRWHDLLVEWLRRRLGAYSTSAPVSLS
jgi:RNA polymerase sigma factor (sigma-70 family)